MEKLKVEEIDDSQDTISVIRLLKEKMSRNQDLFDFKIQSLQNENEFLKNSFNIQNDNFNKIELKLKELNVLNKNILNEKK